MSSATVRVVCSQCGSKLDIRAELAGSKRRCPKCKTEFVVPALEDEDDGVSLVEESETVAETKSETPLPASPAKSLPSAPMSPMRLPAGADDDDDEDYIPSFVTSAAKNEQKTPLPATSVKPADEEDPEPVLSIPKIPPPTKPKVKPFIPEEFEDDADEPPPRRSTPVPSTRESSGRRNRDSDPFDLDEPSPPPKSRGGSRAAGLSDSSIPTPSPTRDRATAARELRQALKDSSLREQPEQQTRGFSLDFSGIWSEIGLKGLALIVGLIIFCPALYVISKAMMVGGVKLPPLGYVTGKVTYDGQPAPNAVVRFMPVPEQGQESDSKKFTKIRTSFGVTDEKGEYKLMYMEGVQGVAVGKCRVWLELTPPLIVPGDFSPAGVTMRDVKSGSQTYDFSLAAPPPRKR